MKSLVFYTLVVAVATTAAIKVVVLLASRRGSSAMATRSAGSLPKFPPSSGGSGSGRVHVLQGGDKRSIREFSHYITENRKAWFGDKCRDNTSAAMIATHTLVEFDDDSVSGDCYFTQKVRLIHEHLETKIPEGDFLLFLDLDVLYEGPTPCFRGGNNGGGGGNRLETPPPPPPLPGLWGEEEEHGQRRCSLVILYAHHTLNTGVILIQNDGDGNRNNRELIRLWYEFERDIRYCDGPADQLSLQSAVLYHLLNGPQQRDDGDDDKNNDNDNDDNNNRTNYCHPDESLGAHRANLCFRDGLEKLLSEKRYAFPDSWCFLRCNDGWQCHDCHPGTCDKGKALFRHEKKKKKWPFRFPFFH